MRVSLWLRSAVYHRCFTTPGAKEGTICPMRVDPSLNNAPPWDREPHRHLHYDSPTRRGAPGKGGKSWMLRIVVDPLVHNIHCTDSGFHVSLFFWTFDNGPMWIIHFDNPWRCWAKQFCGCNSRTRRRRGTVAGFVLQTWW